MHLVIESASVGIVMDDYFLFDSCRGILVLTYVSLYSALYKVQAL